VNDKGPTIETMIGFIETYEDPFHLRAEYEGLVTIVNKQRSIVFKKLVDQADMIID